MRWISALTCSITTGVIRALEAQAPLWPPGTGHGYHVAHVWISSRRAHPTHNWKNAVGLLAGKFRPAVATRFLDRLAGKGEFASGHDLRGENPESFRGGAKNRQSGSDFYRDLVTPGTLARKTFTSPYGLNVISKMNDPKIRAQPIVSFGGIGSASALAKFYSMLANGGEKMGRLSFHKKRSIG